MAWITPDALRAFVGNTKAGDEDLLTLAVDVGCGKVEELCGPIETATITGELHELAGSDRICLRYPAASLVSVATLAGEMLTASDWVIDGQVLRHKLGTAYWTTLVVSYTAGYFDPAGPDLPPAWARSAALHIAQQHMRTLRRFGQTSDGPVGFLVPKAAMEELEDHLLAPDGFA